MWARFFADNYIPLNILERPATRELFYAINSAYTLPTRHNVRKNIITYAQELQQSVSQHIKTGDGFSITADFLTNGPLRVLGVTVHWIDQKFRLNHNTLGIRSQPRGNSMEVHELLHDILSEELNPEHLISITTDGEPLMTSASSRLEKGEAFVCVAHSLNLIVEKSYSSIKGILEVFFSFYFSK